MSSGNLTKESPAQAAMFIPESALYTKLLELERRMDVTLQRKKLDIQEVLNQSEKVACYSSLLHGLCSLIPIKECRTHTECPGWLDKTGLRHTTDVHLQYACQSNTDRGVSVLVNPWKCCW